jgi:hypothetical protein
MIPLLNRVSAAVAACLVATGPAWAFNPQPDPPARFAIVGIVADQIARLHVVAPAPTRGQVNPGPCRARLSFLDGEGVNLIEPADVVIGPGKSTYLDLVANDIVGGRGRIEFLPTVQVQANSTSEPACSGIAASVEIFDASGRTSVFIADPKQYRAH